MKKTHPIVIILLLICLKVLPQSPLDTLAMRAIMANELFPQERVYLHFDNTSYYLGETMWFKGHVVSGDDHTRTAQSKVLYVELCAPEGYVVETKKYRLDDNGRCHGEFELKKSLLSGYFEVRAYTRYMLNWGDDAIFSRVFPVYEPVNDGHYEIKEMLDRKRGTLYRGQWQTNDDIECRLEFYPEGGHLVNGMTSTVAYELLSLNGRPSTDTITIFENGTEILRTVPEYYGKGTFELSPNCDSEYSAIVKSVDKTGRRKEFAFTLPSVEKSGVVIKANEEKDSFHLLLKDNLPDSIPLGVAVLNKGYMQYYRSFKNSRNDISIKIHRDSIAEGVNRIIAFTENGIPLVERQFFVQHHTLQPGDMQTARLRVTVSGIDTESLTVPLHGRIGIDVEREDGLPIPDDAEFSISVTDADTREKNSYSHNMYTHLLLGSELKGYIPDAGRYFDSNNKNRKRELELIMLTHGWTSYDWARLSSRQSSLQHPVETGIVIKGRLLKHLVSKSFGSYGEESFMPQKKSRVTLTLQKDTLLQYFFFNTNDKGNFIISTEDFYGDRYAILSKVFRHNQIINKDSTASDSSYIFILDRYFSPAFKKMAFCETGKPDELNASIGDSKDTTAVRTGFRNWLLPEFKISKAKGTRYARPPRSCVRYDFLNEWEYNYDKLWTERYNETMGECKELSSSNEGIAVLVPLDMGINDEAFMLGYEVHTSREVRGASDVLASAMWRHNFYWSRWTHSIVVKHGFDPDSIPVEDKEYLSGDDAGKMMAFKEFYIRHDYPTRKQYLNSAALWAKKREAMLRKGNAMYYAGFLSRTILHPLGLLQADNYPGAEMADGNGKVMYDGSSGTGMFSPEHPDYVACFVPYTEEERKRQYIPNLANTRLHRYTRLQGYAQSKRFYEQKEVSHIEKEKSRSRTLFWLPDAKNTADGRMNYTFYCDSLPQKMYLDIEGIGRNLYMANRSVENRTDESLSCSTDRSNEIWSRIAHDIEENPANLMNNYRLTKKGEAFLSRKDYDNAFKCFHTAAMDMHSPALLHLGVCHYDGKGTQENKRLGYQCFLIAAQRGETEAYYRLGTCYHDGEAVPKNDSIALEWFKKAAEEQHTASLRTVGNFYEKGVAVDRDEKQAIYYYTMAAQKNDTKAIYCLGRIHARADSATIMNKSQLHKSPAIKYIMQAAELGSGEAQSYLAYCYLNGYYVKRSKKKAFKWMERSVNNGVKEHLLRLAYCYERGIGTKKDEKKAYDTYKVLAKDGNRFAEMKVAEFESIGFFDYYSPKLNLK